MKTYRDWEIDQTAYFLYYKATGDYEAIENVTLERGTVENIGRTEMLVKIERTGITVSLAYDEAFDTLDSLIKALEEHLSMEATRLRRPLEDR
jgi:hypothetical protein